jgi:hypothetical protein
MCSRKEFDLMPHYRRRRTIPVEVLNETVRARSGSELNRRKPAALLSM